LVVPVADVVEGVVEILTGHQRPVIPVATTADHLSEGVVLVHPVGAIGQVGPVRWFASLYW